MNCPRCQAPTADDVLREFGGVCPKCLLNFAEEQDAPAFPNLEIVELIGQGGMGVVYKALQKNLGRTVALKVLSPQLSSDPEFVERFTREARALAQLSHPNIVGIYDSGIHDRVPFLVMEYVKGQSLRQLLAAKQLTAPDVLELVPQICDALYYAHAKGVVHRDIKPENILIDGAGRVKIADYGLAKIASLDQPRITKSNVAMGTPHYMAPEQIDRTSEVDHRADIYSLGVVIYEMLTGELPLGRFKPPSERAEVDRRLDRVVLKTLEREPDDRYQSADEVKAQMAHLDKAPQPPAPSPVAPRLSKLAVASGILSIGALTCFVLSITFAAVHQNAAGVVFAGVAAGLLLVTGPLSIAALIRIGISGGALRGAWIPAVSLLFSAVLFVVGVLGFFVTARQASPPVEASPRTVSRPPSSRRGPGFRLADAWPSPADIPPGHSLENVREGEAALLPYPGVSQKSWRAMLTDLSMIRRARLDEVDLVGFEFKTEEARARWERECGLAPLRLEDGGVPAGRAMFMIQANLPRRADGSLSEPLLRKILTRKMREAADR